MAGTLLPGSPRLGGPSGLRRSTSLQRLHARRHSQAGAGDSPRKRRCCQVSLPRQPHPCRGREGGRGGAPRGTRCVVGAAVRKQTLQARGGAEREGGCRPAQQTMTRTGWASIPEPGQGQGRRRGEHSCPTCSQPEELPKGWELCSEVKKSPGGQLQAKPHPLKGGGGSGRRGQSGDPGPGSCPLGSWLLAGICLLGAGTRVPIHSFPPPGLGTGTPLLGRAAPWMRKQGPESYVACHFSCDKRCMILSYFSDMGAISSVETREARYREIRSFTHGQITSRQQGWYLNADSCD